jgi:hypothetical protein
MKQPFVGFQSISSDSVDVFCLVEHLLLCRDTFLPNDHNGMGKQVTVVLPLLPPVDELIPSEEAPHELQRRVLKEDMVVVIADCDHEMPIVQFVVILRLTPRLYLADDRLAVVEAFLQPSHTETVMELHLQPERTRCLDDILWMCPVGLGMYHLDVGALVVRSDTIVSTDRLQAVSTAVIPVGLPRVL